MIDFKENDLEVAWFYRNEKDKIEKIRSYTVVCRCGNPKLLLAASVLRCQDCGRGHDYGTFLKKKMEAQKLARLNDGRRGRIRKLRVKKQTNKKFILDLKTGKAQEINNVLWNDYSKVILGMKPVEIVCPKCKKKYSYTGLHNLAGIGSPLIAVNNEEQCWECVRKTFLSDK